MIRVFVVRFRGGKFFDQSLTAAMAHQLAKSLTLAGSPATVISFRISDYDLNRLRYGHIGSWLSGNAPLNQ